MRVADFRGCDLDSVVGHISRIVAQSGDEHEHDRGVHYDIRHTADRRHQAVPEVSHLDKVVLFMLDKVVLFMLSMFIGGGTAALEV